jgi:hypothetical protein
MTGSTARGRVFFLGLPQIKKTHKNIGKSKSNVPLSLFWFRLCAACQCLKHFIVFSTLVTL